MLVVGIIVPTVIIGLFVFGVGLGGTQATFSTIPTAIMRAPLPPAALC